MRLDPSHLISFFFFNFSVRVSFPSSIASSVSTEMASDTPFEIFPDPPQASSTNSSNTVATPILNHLPPPGSPENTRFCNGCHVSRPWRDFLKGNGASHNLCVIDNNTTNVGETRFFKQCTRCRSNNKRSDKTRTDRRLKSDEAKYGSETILLTIKVRIFARFDAHGSF